MKTSKLSIEEMSRQEIIEINGGQYFKPSIDGSWVANERSALLKHAKEVSKKNGTNTNNWWSGWSWW